MKRCCAILALVTCLTAGAGAQRPAPKPAAPPAPKAAAVLISGLGGIPGTKHATAYSRNLLDWTNRFHAVLTGKCGLKAGNIIVLTEKADEKAKPPRRQATVENIRDAMKQMKALLKPQDQFILFLAGHGQIQEQTGKLCLPGRDLRSTDLADMLLALPTTKIVIINTASGGADFLKDYLVDGRVIISAGGTEMDGNTTYFAEFFIRGYETGQADTLTKPRKYGNKDGVISLLESYCHAAVWTGNWYHQQYKLEAYRPPRKPGAARRDPNAPPDMTIYWLVRGKEIRKAWNKLYAGTHYKSVRPASRKVQRKTKDGKTELVDLDPLPKDLDAEADFQPKFGRFGKHWHHRRILAEHARLDDTTNTTKALFLWQPYKFEKIAKEVYEGDATWLARRTVLGRPRLLSPKAASR